MVIAARTKRALPATINRIQNYAFVMELTHLIGMFVDPSAHSRENTELLAAELEHFGLEFHPSVTTVSVQSAEYFSQTAYLY